MIHQSPVQQGIVLTLRRRFILVRLPAALLLIGASLLIIAIGPSTFERGAGWVGFLFFTALLLTAVIRLFDKRPQYWINHEGVHCLRSPLGLIAWSDIETAAIVEMRWQQFLCLYLNNPERILSRLSPVQRWLKRMNQDLGFGSLSFALGSLEASPAEIHAYIKRYVPGPDPIIAN